MKHQQNTSLLQNRLAKHWLLGVIVLLAVSLRLVGLTNSVTDWHSFRQADTASVTREYVKHGIDLLHPTYQDLGNIQSGKDNPHGYRMVEFPIINAVLAVILRTFPFLDLVVVSRLASITVSIGTLLCIYVLGKRWGNEQIGLLSALAFSCIPYIVFYSRVILPEPFFTFFLTLSLVSFDIWLEEKNRRRWIWYVISLMSLTFAFLLKPFAVFFAPLFIVLAIRRFKWKVFFQPALYIFALTLLPMLSWWEWIKQYPEGVPASGMLYNKDKIRLRPAWFRWLFWERYTKLILGGSGILSAFLSMLGENKLREMIIVWGVSVLLYMIVLAGGNVQHDYYQSITVPLVSLAVGQGLWVISRMKNSKMLLGIWVMMVVLWIAILKIPEPIITTQLQVQPLLIVTFAISLAVALTGIFVKKLQPQATLLFTATIFASAIIINHWFIRGFYNTRPDYEEAGAAVQRLTPPDAKIIAPAFGDTLFLFQTDRIGWPLGYEIEDKIAKGAQYYVSTAYDDEAKMLEQKYQVIEKKPNHIIIKLTP